MSAPDGQYRMDGKARPRSRRHPRRVSRHPGSPGVCSLPRPWVLRDLHAPQTTEQALLRAPLNASPMLPLRQRPPPGPARLPITVRKQRAAQARRPHLSVQRATTLPVRHSWRPTPRVPPSPTPRQPPPNHACPPLRPEPERTLPPRVSVRRQHPTQPCMRLQPSLRSPQPRLPLPSQSQCPRLYRSQFREARQGRQHRQGQARPATRHLNSWRVPGFPAAARLRRQRGVRARPLRRNRAPQVRRPPR